MNKRQYVRERREAWQRFEVLTAQFERGALARVGSSEISEYSRLFRELSNDLAIIRSRAWGLGLVHYLNHLVARGHNAFYCAPPSRPNDVVNFLMRDFPRVFRAHILYFVVASLLFFLPGAISWIVVQRDPAQARRLMPAEMLEQMEEMYAEPDQSEEDWQGGLGEGRNLMFGFYIRNNIGIALQCFGLGLALGVGTVYVLLYNGIFLGAVSGYMIAVGNAERFLGFVVSHGSFELTAIAVAGGAGLILGNAIVHPGQRTRLESLRVRGGDAVRIAAGAAVMLLIAAGIEAFWSPSPLPNVVKYTGGALMWLSVILYLSLAGRGR